MLPKWTSQHQHSGEEISTWIISHLGIPLWTESDQVAHFTVETHHKQITNQTF